jgi:hypothetical protein
MVSRGLPRQSGRHRLQREQLLPGPRGLIELDCKNAWFNGAAHSIGSTQP